MLVFLNPAHLEADTGNITNGMTAATETGNQHLILCSKENKAMGPTVGYHIKNKTALTHPEHATMHAQQASRLPLLADFMLLSVCRCCMLLQCMRCACAPPPGTPLLRCPA